MGKIWNTHKIKFYEVCEEFLLRGKKVAYLTSVLETIHIKFSDFYASQII